MNILFFIIVFFVVQFMNNVLSYNPLLSYTIRFKKFIIHPNITGNYTIDQYKDVNQFINGNITIHTKEIINKVSVIFERCNSEGINCEYFQSWELTDICHKLNEKNQIWSRWYAAFDPPMVCPIKSSYRLRNGTVDIDPIIRLYPDATDHQWKVTQKLYANTILIGSYTMHVSIFGYRKRNKSILQLPL